MGDSVMVADALRQQVEALERTLAHHGERDAAQVIRQALAGADPDLRTFLVSNELWGGSGSIADQAGIDHAGINRGRESRRALEAALIALGRAQMQQGLVNVRTQMWVEAFSKWQGEGM
jgi:hypothetical protein